MSRGVVLWPDRDASQMIRRLWEQLTDAGIPNLGTHTHRRHAPHLSLTVAQDFPVEDALLATRPVPSEPVDFSIESVGLFPQGVLFLAVVVSEHLLSEQRRVHLAVRPLARDPWPFFEPNHWVPHITVSPTLEEHQFEAGAAICARGLPIHGTFVAGGIEDGSTGDSWPSTVSS